MSLASSRRSLLSLSSFVWKAQWGGAARLDSLRRFADKSGNGEGDPKAKPWFQSIRDAMIETKEK